MGEELDFDKSVSPKKTVASVWRPKRTKVFASKRHSSKIVRSLHLYEMILPTPKFVSKYIGDLDRDQNYQ